MKTTRNRITPDTETRCRWCGFSLLTGDHVQQDSRSRAFCTVKCAELFHHAEAQGGNYLVNTAHNPH